MHSHKFISILDSPRGSNFEVSHQKDGLIAPRWSALAGPTDTGEGTDAEVSDSV